MFQVTYQRGNQSFRSAPVSIETAKAIYNQRISCGLYENVEIVG